MQTKLIVMCFIICFNSVLYASPTMSNNPQTFKTEYYYSKHPDICKKRVEECKVMEEMTFAILEDCRNAHKAKRKLRRNKSLNL